MSYAVTTVLAPAVINEAVAELEVDNESLQRLFGGELGGSNVSDKGGRNFGWDVFNPTREVAYARAPATGPSTISNQPSAVVTGRYPRVHESMPLLYEEVHNQRKIGGPANDIDSMGLDYITEQEQIVKQRVVNHREFQFAAMLRGSYTYTVSGQDLIPAFSGGSITVDYQVPSGNKGGTIGGAFGANLNPLGTGNIVTATWANAATDIPSQLYTIDKQMKQLTGKRLRHIICNASVWVNVQQNTAVRQLSGTANVVFDELNKVEDGSEDFNCILRGMPWVRWHINNEVLNLNGTATLMIPDNTCFFLPNVNRSWVSYWNGSEPVVEWVGRPGHEEYGAYFYATPTANPAGYSLISLMNGIPALKNPSAIMYSVVQ